MFLTKVNLSPGVGTGLKKTVPVLQIRPVCKADFVLRAGRGVRLLPSGLVEALVFAQWSGGQ